MKNEDTKVFLGLSLPFIFVAVVLGVLLIKTGK
jgi:hypothetical protein